MSNARLVNDAGYYNNGRVGSSSIKLYNQSPRKYWYHTREGDKAPSKALRLGSATDACLLEPDRDDLVQVCPHPGTRRTNLYKNWAAGFADNPEITLLTQDEGEEVNKLMKAVRDNPTANKLLDLGGYESLDLGVEEDPKERVRKQVAALYEDTETGVGCRLKADAWKPNSYIVDLKTVDGQRASDGGMAKQIIDFGYDVQAAHYKAGLDELVGFDHPWYLIMVAKVPRPSPLLVWVIKLGQEWIDRGNYIRSKALKGIAAGPPTDGEIYEPMSVDIPGWARVGKKEEGVQK